jgi:hypothetical protein
LQVGGPRLQSGCCGCIAILKLQDSRQELDVRQRVDRQVGGGGICKVAKRARQPACRGGEGAFVAKN